MPKIIQSGRNLIARLHEWQTLIASLINASVISALAIFVTGELTAAMKRTDFFLAFTQRYHQIRADALELDKKVKTNAIPLDEAEGDAYQIYFRLFGLMYDEMHAYQNGFLESNVIVDWMTWQMYDHMGGEFKIGRISYDDGWQWWLTTPAQYHQNTRIMKRIFACKDRACVEHAIE